MNPFTFTQPHSPMIYICFQEDDNVYHLSYWEAQNSRFIYLRRADPSEIESLRASILPNSTTIELIQQNTGTRDNYVNL